MERGVDEDDTHAWLESKCVFVPINRGCAHWMCAVVDVCGRVIYMLILITATTVIWVSNFWIGSARMCKSNGIEVGKKSEWNTINEVLPCNEADERPQLCIII